MPEFSNHWFASHRKNWSEWLGKFSEKKVLGLEIGCFEGQSAKWTAENICIHPESQLICVDPFCDSKELLDAMESFLQNTKDLRSNGKIVHYRQKSKIFLKNTSRTFNFIYVDGDHAQAACLTDLVMGWQVLKVGGLMIIDDYRMSEYGVGAATDFFMQSFSDQLKIIAKGSQVCLQKV